MCRRPGATRAPLGRRLLLPDGRTIPLAPGYDRPLPCGGCGGDLGACSVVHLTRDGARLCPLCFAGGLRRETP